MIDQAQYDRIARNLPILGRADPQLVREFMQAASFARIPVGRDVFVEGDRVDAIATVEQPAEAVMIPSDTFRDWVARYDLWRGFVFDLLSQRLANVMALVDEVAFRRMDRRVATLLLDRSRSQNPVRITHQEIAAELGSSREVISRILEDFAVREMIRLGRGTVEILDLQCLEIFSVV